MIWSQHASEKLRCTKYSGRQQLVPKVYLFWMVIQESRMRRPVLMSFSCLANLSPSTLGLCRSWVVQKLLKGLCDTKKRAWEKYTTYFHTLIQKWVWLSDCLFHSDFQQYLYRVTMYWNGNKKWMLNAGLTSYRVIQTHKIKWNRTKWQQWIRFSLVQTQLQVLKCVKLQGRQVLTWRHTTFFKTIMCSQQCGNNSLCLCLSKFKTLPWINFKCSIRIKRFPVIILYSDSECSAFLISVKCWQYVTIIRYIYADNL